MHGSPTTIVGEPVKYGSVTTASDLVMQTPIIHRPSLNNTDILSVFKQMSPSAFAYMSYCFVLVSIVLSAVAMTTDRPRGPVKAYGNFVKALWSIFETAVDQENYRPKVVHTRSVWLFLSLSVFVFIFGYFLNLISVNQIADQPPILLEKLADFRKPEFQHVNPMMIKNLFYFDVLVRSEEGSDLHYVYDRMVRTGNCSGSNAYNAEFCNVLTLDEQGTKYTSQALSRVLRGLSNIDFSMLANEIINYQLMTIFCLISPESRKNFMVSSRLMSGHLATMFSKKIPYPVYQLYSFRVTSSMLEFGLYSQSISRLTNDLLQTRFPIFSFNNKYFSCIENRHDPKKMEPTPASLTIYRNLIKISLCVIGLSCLLIVIELIIKPIHIRMGSKRGRIRKLKRLFRRHRPRVSHRV